ncbi:aromatic ring-hydroxylating oxygenase subunit alpha [Sphingomonas oligoaromativorans]|jgi:phenylpropionate dioxygenase-like ring-hydroxylating dioxygenase large terminal subunit|uniref:aromatic ring-hydroxylating oxygenase subunit alpha n=1 Tax=Sphingomonas oligoaromativorans TaxID=575322 RepID=UPI00142233B6|nr:aromatic ring-hydroxylating dioxygenase subunit alpha [Sphingomonas oligoaromativorans]NIJ34807.1 phenylpropionate dioxygenase-like ring-hydroxylating dioxygenase large terminal subunit [Sphingomonas oligoaromativorans]
MLLTKEADAGLIVAPRDLRTVGAHPDHWYPICWSRELKPGQMQARRFAGDPVVVVRSKEGVLFALEDRCAHRQVPLSHGVVKGCTVRCGYHGWAYDESGACVDVPYLGRERLPNGVKSYPVHEVDGLIFIFPGNPELADARRPSALGARGDRTYKTRELNREVGAHYTFMHENLFDMNHQFLHRRQMGLMKATCLGRDSGPNWAEVRYTFSRTEGAATIGEGAILGLMRGKDEADRKDRMVIRTDYPHQNLRFWIDEGDPVLSVWLGYTPLDAEQKTNRTFGYLSVKKPGLPLLLDIAWPFITMFTESIFKEDKEIVEMEQAAHDAQGSDWNNEVFPPIRELRAVLERCGAPG